MRFNSYEEEIDYILEYYGPSTLVLYEDECWILLEVKPKINWLKEGF